MTLAFTVVKPAVADDSAAIAASAQVTLLDTECGSKQLTVEGVGNAAIFEMFSLQMTRTYVQR